MTLRYGALFGAWIVIGCGGQNWRQAERMRAATELSDAFSCPRDAVTATRHPEMEVRPSAAYLERLEHVARPHWVEPKPPVELGDDPDLHRWWFEEREQQLESWKQHDATLDPSNDYYV